MNLEQVDPRDRAGFGMCYHRLVMEHGMSAEDALNEAARRVRELRRADELTRGPDSVWYGKKGTKK